ncbi:hypothetical protein D3C76_1500020 [compost metagenome]
MAPSNSQMKPNMATLANSLVPLRFSTVAMTVRANATRVLVTGLDSKPSMAAMYGPAPRETAAMVTHRETE